jgi:nucleoid DNA-binding protein
MFEETPHMVLTKNDLIAKIREETGFTFKAATETVEQLMEIFKSSEVG